MVRKLPPDVELWKDRRGKIRVYFRKGKGRRVALPAAIGSEEFLAAYVAALDGALSAKTEKRSPDAPGTIGALCVSYFKSPEFIALRDTSKAGYRSRLEKIRVAHAHRTLSGMTREGIVTKILSGQRRGKFAHGPMRRLRNLKCAGPLDQSSISPSHLCSAQGSGDQICTE